MIYYMKILGILFALFICFIGGYLIFRSIKPKMKKNEVVQTDLKDIKEQWDWDGTKGEPPIDYVYYYACQFERIRICTKVGFFITGLIIICFSLAAIFESIK